MSMSPDSRIDGAAAARARKAQKKEEISVEQGELRAAPTKFVGYDFLESEAVVETVLPGKKPDELNVIVDRTPCYAEMGGQVGDQGLLHVPGHDRTEVGQFASSIHKSVAMSLFIVRPCQRSRAGTGRSGAHLGRCRSAQIDSRTSHRYAFVALGACTKWPRVMRHRKGATSARTN